MEEEKYFIVNNNLFKAKNMIKHGAKYVDCVYNKRQDKMMFRFEKSETTFNIWNKIKSL